MVKDVDQQGVTIETHNDTQRLNARTVIWAGGVTVSTLGRTVAKRTNAETDRGGRIKVNSDLTVPNYPDIYVIGDLALLQGANGKALPGVAQVAMQHLTFNRGARLITGPAATDFNFNKEIASSHKDTRAA